MTMNTPKTRSILRALSDGDGEGMTADYPSSIVYAADPDRTCTATHPNDAWEDIDHPVSACTYDADLEDQREYEQSLDDAEAAR